MELRVASQGLDESQAAGSGTPALHGPARWGELALQVTVGAALVVIPVLVVLEVLFRDAFSTDLAWYQDVVSLCVYVITFVGGALAYLKRRHLRVTAVSDRLRPGLRAGAEAVGDWVALVVAVALIISSITPLRLDWIQKMQVLPISSTWALLPLPVGMAAVAVIAAVRICRLPRKAALCAGVATVGITVVLAAGTRLVPGFPVGTAFDGTILVVLALALLLIGVPVVFIFAGVATFFLYLTGLAPMTISPVTMQNGVESFILVALPCFFLLAYLVDKAGLVQRLVDVIGGALGRVRHGVLYTVIVTMYVFSGISGSKSADIAAVGRPIVTMTDDQGYTRAQAGALLGASAVMGETIPPSIALLVVGSISTLSVGALFLGGIIPAAVGSVALALLVTIRPVPKAVRTGSYPHLNVAKVLTGVVPVLAAVVFLIGSIVGGFSTPTEASALVVAFVLVISVVGYRSLSLRACGDVVMTASVLCGAILMLVAAAAVVSNAVSFAGVANGAADLARAVGNRGWAFFLISMLIFLVGGAILEGLPALLLFIPIFVPVAQQLGINTLQYGIAAILAMGIGNHTPPIGVGLYTASVVSETRIEEIGKVIVPYLLALVVVLLLIMLIPDIVLVLPRAFGIG